MTNIYRNTRAHRAVRLASMSCLIAAWLMAVPALHAEEKGNWTNVL